MPTTEVVAVVALGGVTRGRAEVLEVAVGLPRPVLVVAQGRARPLFVPPPARSVALLVLLDRPVLVGVIARREDRRRDAARNDLIEKLGGLLVPIASVGGDIARADENRVVRRRGTGWRGHRTASRSCFGIAAPDDGFERPI